MDSQSDRLNDGVVRRSRPFGRQSAKWSVPRSCDPPCSAMKPTAERRTHSSLTPGRLRSSARSMSSVWHQPTSSDPGGLGHALPSAMILAS